VLQRAVDVLPRLVAVDDHLTLARIHTMIASWLDGAKQDARGALRHAELAAESARRVGYVAEERRAVTISLLALVLGPTPVNVAKQRVEEVLAAADDLVVTARCCEDLAMLAAMEDDIVAARRFVAQAREAHAVLGVPTSYACQTAGQAEYLAGDLAAAEDEMRCAVQGMEDQHSNATLTSFAPILADILIDCGKPDDAAPYVELATRYVDEDDIDAQYRIARARARLLLRQNRLADAEAAARHAQELVAPGSEPIASAEADMALAEVLTRTGRYEEAASMLRRARAFYAAKGVLAGVRRTQAALDGLPAATGFDH
jgi:tetratricopeptide (TPR) repeat protein